MYVKIVRNVRERTVDMEMGIQILSFQRGCERCFYFILYFKLNKYREKIYNMKMNIKMIQVIKLIFRYMFYHLRRLLNRDV